MTIDKKRQIRKVCFKGDVLPLRIPLRNGSIFSRSLRLKSCLEKVEQPATNCPAVTLPRGCRYTSEAMRSPCG
ncbi:MAG: hypothetical protein F6K35_17300 [Okeania sp. SIO2H7]|nr:hypothetical protein [Okeania sp. SIO2H7]